MYQRKLNDIIEKSYSSQNCNAIQNKSDCTNSCIWIRNKCIKSNLVLEFVNVLCSDKNVSEKELICVYRVLSPSSSVEINKDTLCQDLKSLAMLHDYVYNGIERQWQVFNISSKEDFDKLLGIVDNYIENKTQFSNDVEILSNIQQDIINNSDMVFLEKLTETQRKDRFSKLPLLALWLYILRKDELNDLITGGIKQTFTTPQSEELHEPEEKTFETIDIEDIIEKTPKKYETSEIVFKEEDDEDDEEYEDIEDLSANLGQNIGFEKWDEILQLLNIPGHDHTDAVKFWLHDENLNITTEKYNKILKLLDKTKNTEEMVGKNISNKYVKEKLFNSNSELLSFTDLDRYSLKEIRRRMLLYINRTIALRSTMICCYCECLTLRKILSGQG